MSENQSLSLETWKTLATRLECEHKSTWGVSGSIENEKELMKKRLQNKNISWKCLKSELYDMDKKDVIENVRKNTNLTKGNKYKVLKQKLSTSLIKELKKKSFLEP